MTGQMEPAELEHPRTGVPAGHRAPAVGSSPPHHGHGGRGAWPIAARLIHGTGRRRRTPRNLARGRRDRHESPCRRRALPRELVTRAALENAAAVVAATGGSTNARAAPAGHRQRGRDRFRLRRYRRRVRPHASDRRSLPRRALSRQARPRHWRHAGDPEGAARRRSAARRLPDYHRRYAGRRAGRRAGTRWHRRAPRVQRPRARWGTRGAQGQFVPGGRAAEGRGDSGPSRTRGRRWCSRTRNHAWRRSAREAIPRAPSS